MTQAEWLDMVERGIRAIAIDLIKDQCDEPAEKCIGACRHIAQLKDDLSSYGLDESPMIEVPEE